jgi:succinate dehydrogenase flavin-adding protein (antitoxin of CptAB toxin-antitoxin module)
LKEYDNLVKKYIKVKQSAEAEEKTELRDQYQKILCALDEKLPQLENSMQGCDKRLQTELLFTIRILLDGLKVIIKENSKK